MINVSREVRHNIVVNHLDNINTICTKTGLVKYLRKYYKTAPEPAAFQYSIHDSMATSFIVVSNSQEADYHAFVQRFKELEKGFYGRESMPGKHCTENVWLVKPAAMNQGRGIQIFQNDLLEMKRFLETRPAYSHWVIQKYIERPLLYRSRKFDIRIWALATWKGELFYYRHGYLRTSSDVYSLDTKQNYVHLTNNCLQQYGNKYGMYEDGNTISFEVFKNYLSTEYAAYGVDFDKHIVPRMIDLMIDTYLSVKSVLNPAKRRNCFELLGFDFLIDEDFRVWLIEVNTNPYLGIPNKFIEGLLVKMLNDMLEVVLDPYFPPTNPLPRRGMTNLISGLDHKNQFELLYDEKKKVNLRRSFATSLYPIPARAQVSNALAPLVARVCCETWMDRSFRW
jgi:hypothetical protein